MAAETLSSSVASQTHSEETQLLRITRHLVCRTKDVWSPLTGSMLIRSILSSPIYSSFHQPFLGYDYMASPLDSLLARTIIYNSVWHSKMSKAMLFEPLLCLPREITPEGVSPRKPFLSGSDLLCKSSFDLYHCH